MNPGIESETPEFKKSTGWIKRIGTAKAGHREIVQDRRNTSAETSAGTEAEQ